MREKKPPSESTISDSWTTACLRFDSLSAQLILILVAQGITGKSSTFKTSRRPVPNRDARKWVSNSISPLLLPAKVNLKIIPCVRFKYKIPKNMEQINKNNKMNWQQLGISNVLPIRTGLPASHWPTTASHFQETARTKLIGRRYHAIGSIGARGAVEKRVLLRYCAMMILWILKSDSEEIKWIAKTTSSVQMLINQAHQ